MLVSISIVYVQKMPERSSHNKYIWHHLIVMPARKLVSSPEALLRGMPMTGSIRSS